MKQGKQTSFKDTQRKDSRTFTWKPLVKSPFYSGVDYYSKEIASNKTSLVLSIWDTCGDELEFKILPSNVYKIASAYIIVCSYDKRESFEMLKAWILHVQNFVNNHRNFNSLNTTYLIPLVILINKADIKQNRTFKISDITKLIDEFTMNILVYEVSAKENTKIDYVFEKVAGLITGKLAANNETSLNTTGCLEEENLRGSIEITRKKSFQLKENNGNIDRDKNKNGSCCNKQ